MLQMDTNGQVSVAMLKYHMACIYIYKVYGIYMYIPYIYIYIILYPVIIHYIPTTSSGCSLKLFFPECVARVPVSLWGSGGWGCVRWMLRLRPRLLAAVHNRPHEGRMAVPMVSFAHVVAFESFRCRVAPFTWQVWHFVTFRRVL